MRPFRTFAVAIAALAIIPTAALAEMHAHDAYARFLPGAKSGAAYMLLENHDAADDRLIGAISRVADKVEIHESIKGEGGLMRMQEVEGGVPVPALGQAPLTPGGVHLMFMGVTETPPDGGTVPVTLIFEKAGEITIDIKVDNKRAAHDGAATEMGTMDDGTMTHGTTSGADGD